MEFKPYFVFGAIIFYLLYHFIMKAIIKYLQAEIEKETQEEEREERIESFRRRKDFIIKQRMKGAKQWHSLHN